MLKRYISIMMLMASTSVFALSNQQVDEDLKRDLESVLPKTGEVKIPELGSAEYGALETNQTALQVKKFDVVYSAKPPAVLENAIKDMLSQYNGQTLTLQQVVQITRQVEKSAVQLGYPLVRIVLPAQQFVAKDAVVKFNVVSGHIENISVDFAEGADIKDSTKKTITTFITNAWAELRSDKFLNSDNLNRSLLTLKSHYGVSPSFFVSRGETLGGFKLNVSVAYNPRINFVSVKNNLGTSFDRYSVQYVGMFNKVHPTYSRQIRLISIVSAKQVSDNYYRMLKLEYNRKSVTGNEWGVYASANRTKSKAGVSAVNQGTNNAYGMSYTTPLSTNFNKKSSLKFALDVIRDSSYNANTSKYIYQDRTSVFGVTYAYDMNRSNGVSHGVALTLRQGLDMFGSKSGTSGGVASSKKGAIVQNTIYEALYNYKKPYTNFLYHITLNGQYSREQAVLSGQKFSLMGGDKVAGFVGDGMSADSGLTVNTGFTFKTVKVGNRGFSTTLDFAYGSGRVYNATAEESETPRARSVKFGVSTNINKMRWQFGYSIARKHDKKVADDKHFSLSVLRLF